MTTLSDKLSLLWPRAKAAPTEPAATLFSLRRMTSLTLGLLVVVVAVALYGIYTVVY